MDDYIVLMIAVAATATAVLLCALSVRALFNLTVEIWEFFV